MSMNQFKRRASYYARTGFSRAKDIGEMAKLQVDNISDESKIKELYAEIGKEYYSVCGLNPDVAFVTACEKITEIKTRVEEKKNRITELKINGVVDDEVCEPDEI